MNYIGGFADIANGIPNTFETRFASASMGKTFVAVGILQLIEEEKLRFEDTIGVILDFDVYLKQNVFDRCGMSSTGYFSFDKLPSKCANSYIYCPDTDDYRTNIYSVGAKGTGDGGAFVTVEDILKFSKGLLEHKLLSEQMERKCFPSRAGTEKIRKKGITVMESGSSIIPKGRIMFICKDVTTE